MNNKVQVKKLQIKPSDSQYKLFKNHVNILSQLTPTPSQFETSEIFVLIVSPV